MATTTESEVRERAAEWLALVDRGDGRGSWETAGGTFRAAVTADGWTNQMAAARGPLGQLTSRVLAVEQFMNGLPGAPRGEYAVQQYHAVFDRLHAVTETVTLVRETDGAWRVVGYFIR